MLARRRFHARRGDNQIQSHEQYEHTDQDQAADDARHPAVPEGTPGSLGRREARGSKAHETGSQTRTAFGSCSPNSGPLILGRGTADAPQRYRAVCS